ncbi:hypothetical protein BJ165DRAFT_1434921 [Panaeolus papilionaceus]|nr:hypothetical protein BJ165DRAFT_1434921 [Panaeolus papilionaceus]
MCWIPYIDSQPIFTNNPFASVHQQDNNNIMASLTHAISDLIQAVLGVFTGLFQAVFSIFHAAFATTTHFIKGTFSATEHVITAGVQLCEGAFGFIAANFVALAVLGGLFYAYKLYSSPRRNQSGVWEWPSNEKQEGIKN